MPTKKPISVDSLWRLQRLGTPSLSPDGAQAVCSVTTPNMDENKSRSTLWLLSTLGGRPRALTQAGDKDSAPQFSPRGHDVAFIAQREQEGAKDDCPQLYVVPVDGGEARRAGTVATGVEAFRWHPDGQRLLVVSWVWPLLKGSAAQAAAAKKFKARKETGYVTEEAQYRHWDHSLPQDRVPHLHLLDSRSGRLRDLFEGTAYELSRAEPDANSFDVSSDGRRIVFAHDPAPQKRIEGRRAIVELDLRSGEFQTLVQDADWDFGAPRYSPGGERIAFTASHQGQKHTMPAQLALWSRAEHRWDVVSAQWDHEVQAPLLWEEAGDALLFTAEHQGRRPLWRFDLADQRAEMLVPGGCVQGFDKAAGTLVTLADSAQHPAQISVHNWVHGEDAPRRMEHFNDALMATLDLGRSEAIWITGALGDRVQVWLTYPPGFERRRKGSKAPLLHNIHGGPHTAAGDNWHYRWNVHTFAAQGYVVASVNYHGSSSFGNAFLDSITHRWGELELQDIEAATDALLKQPWADKRRVFAAGGSYGGFMAAWMNGHVKPGRYAAYICHAGCFDWTAMFADDCYTWHPKELGAWYWDNPAQLARQSPSAFAGQMQTPTLVVHGALDYRVPDAQGLAYYNTLKARGVKARLLWFPDENHWVLKPQNSALWYREFFDWLARHDRQPKAAARAKAP